MPNPAGPRLMIERTRLLTPLSDVVPSDLIAAFDGAPRHPSPEPGLMVKIAAGEPLVYRLERLGHTAEAACESLTDTIRITADAHRGLSTRLREQLDWPAEAEELDAAGWLAAYAMVGPAPWLLDLAGGLAPATLLRCCLLARPETEVELWLPLVSAATPRWRADLGRIQKPTGPSAGEAMSLHLRAHAREETGQEP